MEFLQPKFDLSWALAIQDLGSVGLRPGLVFGHRPDPPQIADGPSILITIPISGPAHCSEPRAFVLSTERLKRGPTWDVIFFCPTGVAHCSVPSLITRKERVPKREYISLKRKPSNTYFCTIFRRLRTLCVAIQCIQSICIWCAHLAATSDQAFKTLAQEPVTRFAIFFRYCKRHFKSDIFLASTLPRA